MIYQSFLAFALSFSVSRSPDIDLIMADSAFNEASFIRARYLSCPGW